MTDNLYPDLDPMKLEPDFSRHMLALTAEGLHDKSAIAEQLAWRDQTIRRLEAAALASRAALLDDLAAVKAKAVTRDRLAVLKHMLCGMEPDCHSAIKMLVGMCVE